MRLEVSRRADLAVHGLAVLAAAGRRVKATELAGMLGATPGFVPQVLAPLVERRWVRSNPGPTGGYTCLVALEDLSVLEVIEAIEGPTDTGRCVLDDRPCGLDRECALHAAWQLARAQLIQRLAGVTVADVRAGEPSR